MVFALRFQHNICGHVFVKLFVDNKWILVDPANGRKINNVARVEELYYFIAEGEDYFESKLDSLEAIQKRMQR